MNEIVNTQLQLFLYAIAMGILMGMIYDLTRIFRVAIKHPNFLVQIEDGLYWILCGLLIFGILYMHNYGQMRFFIFFGMILGAVFYFYTFSILFMKSATWMINMLKKLVIELIRLVSIPIKILIKLIRIPLTYFKQVMKRQLFRYKKKRHRVQRKQYYDYADRKTQKKISQMIGKE